MRNVLESCVVAFSMYSSIPMPRINWTKENMKYAMCFFPLVGVVEAILFFVWTYVARSFEIQLNFYAVVSIVIPIIVTGGIHMDGFCDVVDALSSHQEREKKLQILKDPHMGAFSVIGCVAYYFVSYGIWSEIGSRITEGLNPIPIIGLGFILSRCFSGLSVVMFPCAKNSGLAATFSNGADKRKVRAIMFLEIILCMAIMSWYNWQFAIGCFGVSVAVFLYYYAMSRKHFGGITGDLAGWFLQIDQMSILLVVMLLQIIGGY